MSTIREMAHRELDHVLTKDEMGHNFGLILPTAVRAALATLPSDFTGKIEINCFKGGVGNINISWSVKTS